MGIVERRYQTSKFEVIPVCVVYDFVGIDEVSAFVLSAVLICYYKTFNIFTRKYTCSFSQCRCVELLISIWHLWKLLYQSKKQSFVLINLRHQVKIPDGIQFSTLCCCHLCKNYCLVCCSTELYFGNVWDVSVISPKYERWMYYKKYWVRETSCASLGKHTIECKNVKIHDSMSWPSIENSNSDCEFDWNFITPHNIFVWLIKKYYIFFNFERGFKSA